MKRIKTVANIVESVLQEYPYTRASDNALYLEVCKRVNPLCVKYSFGDVLIHINDLDLPKYESVSRAGRKIRVDHPELMPTEEVTEGRYEAFKAVLDYV